MKSPTLDDEDLASVVAARQSLSEARTALEVLYQRHALALSSFLASRVARSDLDEVNQAVWLRVWERLPSGFQKDHFRGWLFQIAKNHLIDLSRKRRPELSEGIHEQPGAERLPEQSLIDAEEADALRNCLKKLDETSRRLVRGKLGGENYATLCEDLKIDSARAHKMFFVAKGQLKKCVETILR